MADFDSNNKIMTMVNELSADQRKELITMIRNLDKKTPIVLSDDEKLERKKASIEKRRNTMASKRAAKIASGLISEPKEKKPLSDEEKEDRAEFAYEACVVMRNRFGSDNVMKHYGWDVEEAQEVLNQSESARLFNNLLFSKIMPNLKRIGLLTEKTQEKYEQMDILQFQDLEDDKVIDWDEMSKPLEYSSKTA